MRKLYVSIFMMLCTLLTFTASTWAFVVMSQEAEIDEFEFNVETQDGILLSLDGVSYKNSITAEELNEYIHFDTITLTGVTVKHENNQIVKDNGEVKFVKNQWANYTEVGTDAFDSSKEYYIKKNGEYKRCMGLTEFAADETYYYLGQNEYVDAVKNTNYIYFDLYVLNSGSGAASTKELFFADGTGFSAEDQEIALVNSLTTQEQTYNAGYTLKVNPANAMRLGVGIGDTLNVYEVSQQAPYAADLGSMALEGATDAAHNPTKNAMYTYYNNLFERYKFDKAADPEDAANKDILTSYTETKITDIQKNTPVQLRVYIWLEGWDADYLSTIPFSKIDTNLILKFGD